MNHLHQFIFGIYPYIAISIFILGSVLRFELGQYTWRSESSQVIEKGNLRIANYLFHIGILGVLAGHIFGLLMPTQVWTFLGISHSFKQMMAMVVGGIFGVCALVGLLMLIYRRVSSSRLRVYTSWRDQLVLLAILITLCLGLSTIFVSAKHTDGKEMMQLIYWVQHILTFRGDAANYLIHIPIIYKIHIFMGLTLMIIFPFTRLVHIWSGFGAVAYFARSWQLMRSKG